MSNSLQRKGARVSPRPTSIWIWIENRLTNIHIPKYWCTTVSQVALFVRLLYPNQVFFLLFMKRNGARNETALAFHSGQQLVINNRWLLSLDPGFYLYHPGFFFAAHPGGFSLWRVSGGLTCSRTNARLTRPPRDFASIANIQFISLTSLVKLKIIIIIIRIFVDLNLEMGDRWVLFSF